MDRRNHIAGLLYLDYCRAQGMKRNLSDEEVLSLFHGHWMHLFASRTGKEAWLRRADVAIKAYESYNQENSS